MFEEPTADRCSSALRPDVHAKGTDYRADTVPERATRARDVGAQRRDHRRSEGVTRARELVERVRARMAGAADATRILAIRLRALGDVVLTTPALRALAPRPSGDAPTRRR
mgnify:CR=1 FL=1